MSLSLKIASAKPTELPVDGFWIIFPQSENHQITHNSWTACTQGYPLRTCSKTCRS